MKKTLFTLLGCALLTAGFAQQSTNAPAAPRDEAHGFRKDKLFTGGSVSLGFGSGYFLGGINPVLGYELTSWLDAGIAVNYTFTQQRYIGTDNFNRVLDDKARQSVYGGGVFTRIFPVNFLFAQGQIEHNFINFKYYPPNGGTVLKDNRQATSLLVGAGYTSGRGQGGPYGYLAVLFDVMKDENSPYLDNYGHIQPLVRAGLNIPLFRGRRNADFDRGGPLRR
ncbi:MAG: hypothetical protein EOO12_15025 [Chitinophagaceae bacterium]|nr:MAG: hypothetical protein EOO12_15025 [Chitinophagaceae bacterium]